MKSKLFYLVVTRQTSLQYAPYGLFLEME